MCSAHVVVTEHSVNKFELQVFAPRHDLHGFVTEGSPDNFEPRLFVARNMTAICQSYGHARVRTRSRW
jgi:hypothetical protein